jgi:hypothetical protein
MVAGTIGLLTIAYKASSVSIEIANTKIELLSVISQTKEIRASLEAESKQLAAAKQLLEKNSGALEKTSKSSSNTIHIDPLTTALKPPLQAVGDLKYQGKFEAIAAQIKSAEEVLRK